jgi:hypothetical protein
MFNDNDEMCKLERLLESRLKTICEKRELGDEI